MAKGERQDGNLVCADLSVCASTVTYLRASSGALVSFVLLLHLASLVIDSYGAQASDRRVHLDEEFY